ncbi:unnamed protein product [Prunus armeniaca]|uniref:Uncharacterized protein n=1 Tax=Prunus armeniaca TaxID=36596 RepID=A0A6J5WR86_PRUAR|nr:unnamed protein product [Prunus armeniaca]CAB4300800.1 unnamed protein product [Prunus armeniaca]CAB4300808.1 unnamed protein product [Prunus armeniaca]
MSLETFQVRIGEAEAKTNDLKASFENLWGMVKMPQDASSSTVRDTRGLSGLIAVCLSGT